MLQIPTSYFDFLRFCLDSEMPVPQSVSTIEWHELLKFARKQSIVGVYFFGMQRLVNHSNKPTDDDVLEWYPLYKEIVSRNKLMYEKSSLVCRNFLAEGFRSCILKGQGNALYYPDPYIRQSGDIDVWVEGKPRDIISYVRNLSPNAYACYHHIDFPRMRSAEVEVHYRPAYMNNLLHNRRLQHFFRKNAAEQYENIAVLPDGENKINVPTTKFNRVYQLAHIANHILREGIGLRHICDYYLLLRQSYGEFTIEEHNEEILALKKCGLMPIARALSYVIKTIFQSPDDMLITKPDERRGKLLLNEILQGGNFGSHHQNHTSSASSALKRNLLRLKRDLILVLHFSSEAISEPIFRLYHFLWRQQIKLKN